MKIGIIGGGQLGMMMAEAAIPMGHSIVSLDPNPKCPLSYYSNKHITAAYDDLEAILKMVKLCDVITYEFENVDFNLVKQFEDIIPQKSKALFVTKNRLREKSFAKELGIATPTFYRFEGMIHQVPCVVKTTEGGYDGKGQFYLMTNKDVSKLSLDSNVEYIVEEFIEYDYEISVVVTRDTFNNVVTFPITRNIHKNGILFRSLTYVDISEKASQTAIEYATKIINELDYVGTMAIEFFVKGDHIIFNEYAPRPHNSGHYTIEGTTVSQFKNHILAITKDVIKEPKLIAPTEMINVLGQDMVYVERAQTLSNTNIHMYHKDKVVPNRKMGHLTIVEEDVTILINKSEFITGE